MAVLVAPVGGNDDSLFVAVREFKLDKVVLLATNDKSGYAESVSSDLANFSIPSEIIVVSDILRDFFKVVSDLKNTEKEIIVNASSGDDASNSAALSAAFANGLKAFHVLNSKVIMLPVLGISYYDLLTEKKRQILGIIATGNSSLEGLGKKTGMSLPLLSYHLNGTLKVKGLKELGLVEVVERRGKVIIGLTDVGKILIHGL
jgi:DNA-binding transcriptional ArsR family regulator